MSRTVALIALAIFAFAGSGIAAAYAGVPATASGFAKEMSMNGAAGKPRKARAAWANSAVIQIAFSAVTVAPIGRFADPFPSFEPVDLRAPLRIEGIASVLTRLDITTMTRPAKPEGTWRDFRVADPERRPPQQTGDGANGQDKVNLTLACRGTGGMGASPGDMVCEAGLVLSLK
jgi:hypothetical protein